MAYLKFISMSFQRSIAYRVEYFTALLNAFLYIFIFTSVWKVLIPEHSTVDGLSRTNMIAYAVLSTLIKATFGRNDSMLSTRIRSGEIAVDLMKPFSFPLMYLSDTIGSSLFQIFARAIPLLIFSWVFFNISLDINAQSALLFVPLYLLSFLLFFLLSFLISSMAFYFVDLFPFWVFYYALITLTSGAIVPVDFFPEAFQKVLYATPFPYLFYVPTMILIKGTAGGLTILQLFSMYGILIGITAMLAYASYRTGLKKLAIAGG